MIKAAFFDLDLTVIRVNSATLWAKTEWKRGGLPPSEVLRATWWALRYKLGSADLDHALRHAARRYRGRKASELQAEIDQWFAAEIAPEVRPGALSCLSHFSGENVPCILATSSSQFVAKAAAETFGFDEIICTTAEVIDDTLTGELSQLGLGDHKRVACTQWAESRGVPLSDCAFYTDSFTDLPLLEAVGYPVVVHPDPRLARWARQHACPIKDWESASGETDAPAKP